MVQARALCKRFGDRQVLDALDLELSYGDFALVTGPNGSGKTTLLRLVAPELVDEPRGRERLVRVQREQRQERALLGTREGNRPSGTAYLERPE